jgi:imidazole glycerol-phosphate synthase subunit HisH
MIADRVGPGREAEEPTRICVLDYGMGNLRSVEKAFAHVDVEAVRTSDRDTATEADGLVLPGVGAFPKAMERVRKLRLDELVIESAAQGKPVLGICLGMQLLFESTTELGGAEGLGLLSGPVTGLDAGDLKVPHIGWSPVSWTRESRLTEGLVPEEPFYFVHSFAPRPADAADTLGTADYGESFTCVVERGNVFGAQFHPEKSSGAGLRLLRNFAAICSAVPA